MLWFVIAALGNVPTAIIACVGLVLGVLMMARGARGGARETVAAQPTPAPVVMPIVPAVAVTPAEPATSFRHGTIKLADDAGPEPAAEAQMAPRADEPAPPAPAPQVPKTTFRQGTIRVGGLERGRREP